MFGFVARFCWFCFGLLPDRVWLGWAVALGCSFSVWVPGSLNSCVDHGACLLVQDVGLLADIGKRSSCSELIQETLNQADEAHSRRLHDGQDRLQQQHRDQEHTIMLDSMR